MDDAIGLVVLWSLLGDKWFRLVFGSGDVGKCRNDVGSFWSLDSTHRRNTST